MKDQVIYKGEVVGTWTHRDDKSQMNRANSWLFAEHENKLRPIDNIVWHKRKHCVDKRSVLAFHYSKSIPKLLGVAALPGIDVTVVHDNVADTYTATWLEIEALDEEAMLLLFDAPQFEPGSLNPELDEDAFATGGHVSHGYTPSRFGKSRFLAATEAALRAQGVSFHKLSAASKLRGNELVSVTHDELKDISSETLTVTWNTGIAIPARENFARWSEPEPFFKDEQLYKDTETRLFDAISRELKKKWRQLAHDRVSGRKLKPGDLFEGGDS